MPLVDAPGSAHEWVFLVVRIVEAGIELRLQSGSLGADLPLVEGFGADVESPAVLTCTASDAALLLSCVRRLQSLRVDVVYSPGVCGATVEEFLRRCSNVAREIGGRAPPIARRPLRASSRVPMR